MWGEDEEWLREISINMDPEEGQLWVIGIGEPMPTPSTAKHSGLWSLLLPAAYAACWIAESSQPSPRAPPSRRKVHSSVTSEG